MGGRCTVFIGSWGRMIGTEMKGWLNCASASASCLQYSSNLFCFIRTISSCRAVCRSSWPSVPCSTTRFSLSRRTSVSLQVQVVIAGCPVKPACFFCCRFLPFSHVCAYIHGGIYALMGLITTWIHLLAHTHTHTHTAAPTPPHTHARYMRSLIAPVWGDHGALCVTYALMKRWVIDLPGIDRFSFSTTVVDSSH